MSQPNMMNTRKKYVQLNPVNAVSSGEYSSKGGLPMIKFDLSSHDAPMFLQGDELRICGRITSTQGAGGALGNTDKNFVDNFCGRFANCIHTVTISSKRLNQVIERVENYWRIVPSVVSAVHGNEDINTQLSHEGDHFETLFLGRHSLVAQDAGDNKGKSFSSRLYAGCLNSGQMMDLSKNGFGGLVIEILLKPDVSVVFGDDALANSATFKLSDLKLTAPLYYMDAAAAPPQQTFAFNSLSTVFQTINSSTSVVALTPGLKQVSSIFCNFQNANEVGNQNFNSARLGNIGEVRGLRYSLNGALYPLSYRMLTDEEANNATTTHHSYQYRTLIDRNYLEAVSVNRFCETNRTVLAYNNWNAGVVDRVQTQNNDGVDQGTAAGIGILYDSFGTGEDLSQTVFSFELEASGADLDGTAANAQGVYMVFLNKNQVIMSADGIQIVR
tara:strand:- start:748 stop:2076 length:1329 start_codon:yes stop_codon:yes gene_type:complete